MLKINIYVNAPVSTTQDSSELFRTAIHLFVLSAGGDPFRVLSKIGGTRLLHKNCEAIGVTAQRSLPFPGGKWVARKSENIDYIWHYASDLFIHSPYVWENYGILNRNYWNDLDIIHQGYSKGNISQFCLYIG